MSCSLLLGNTFFEAIRRVDLWVIYALKCALGDLLIGAAAQVAEYNGAAKASHIRSKLVDMVILNETLYCCGLAAASQGVKTPSGVWHDDPVLSNVVKNNVTKNMHKIGRLAEDIAGGLITTQPSEKDWRNPKTRPYIEKYLKGVDGVPTEHRMRMFKLIEFLTYGQGATYSRAEAMHGAGAPETQKVFISRTYDFESLKKFARVSCGIDLIAGPTEILIIADESADPPLVACDLLGQAEHDLDSGICLITTSLSLAEAASKEVVRQLETLPTREVASVSWANNGIIMVAEDDDEAIRLSDDYAPEHLELHVANRDYYFDRLRNYGSLFIGEETTVAYGDKSIGTNHILPTGRVARYTGGLWVGTFLKTCTYQHMTPQANQKLAEVTERICNLEGMSAHAITARIRLERFADDK